MMTTAENIVKINKRLQDAGKRACQWFLMDAKIVKPNAQYMLTTELSRHIDTLTMLNFELTIQRKGECQGIMLTLKKTKDGKIYQMSQIVPDSHYNDSYILQLLKWQEEEINKLIQTTADVQPNIDLQITECADTMRYLREELEKMRIQYDTLIMRKEQKEA